MKSDYIIVYAIKYLKGWSEKIKILLILLKNEIPDINGYLDWPKVNISEI